MDSSLIAQFVRVKSTGQQGLVVGTIYYSPEPYQYVVELYNGKRKKFAPDELEPIQINGASN